MPVFEMEDVGGFPDDVPLSVFRLHTDEDVFGLRDWRRSQNVVQTGVRNECVFSVKRYLLRVVR